MKDANDFVEKYMVRLLNAGTTSVTRAELSLYLQSVGFERCEDCIDSLLQRKTLISLSTGKVTLNVVKLRKKQRHKQ